MNDNLQKNLADYRKALVFAIERVAMFRRIGQLNSNDHELFANAIAHRHEMADRVWELQCMTSGSYLT